MVQEFNVLVCYECRTFQVDQVKKSTNKWVCKICRKKQSVKQIFFRGNGKDCRVQVQQLNMIRGSVDQSKNNEAIDNFDFAENQGNCQANITGTGSCGIDSIPDASKSMSSTESKWAKFTDHNLDQDSMDNNNNENVTTARAVYNHLGKLPNQGVRLKQAKMQRARTPYARVSREKGQYNIDDVNCEPSSSIAFHSSLFDTTNYKSCGNNLGIKPGKNPPIEQNLDSISYEENGKYLKPQDLAESTSKKVSNPKTSTSKWDAFL